MLYYVTTNGKFILYSSTQKNSGSPVEDYGTGINISQYEDKSSINPNLGKNEGGARNSSDQVESTFDSHLRPPTRRAYLVSAQSSVTNDQEKSDNWSSGDE